MKQQDGTVGSCFCPSLLSLSIGLVSTSACAFAFMWEFRDTKTLKSTAKGKNKLSYLEGKIKGFFISFSLKLSNILLLIFACVKKNLHVE